ncbi:MAG: hypothetical protein PHD43_05865 [Methylococcales bacterium]|nr:hypothetical protein [Methylococcales bacterium]
MQHKRNKKLITNVLIVGIVIAILSYLFHPGVGQFSVMLNGEPVADPLVRFAAIPTLLIIMAITGFLITLLFIGIGMFMFLGAIFVALAIIAIMAPYFWPVLIIIFLIIGLMAFSHGDKI